MKARYLRREKGQGCIEFLVALAVIVILILAVVWIISGLIVLIRENLKIIQSTPLPATQTVETVVPPEFLSTPGVATYEVSPVEKVTSETPVGKTDESTATPSQPATQEKTFWENISDWINGR